MAFLPTTASQIQQFAMALYGYQIGSITMAAVQSDVAVLGGLNNTLNAYYNVSFGSLPTATVAANLVKNVGISTGADAAVAYVKAILDTTPAASRGVAVEGILNTFSKMTADATYGAAATYYNTRHAIAMNYTGESDVAVGTVPAVQVIPLTNGVDILTGTYLDDTFRAALGDDVDGDGTVNPGDLINGGAGYDTLQMRVTEYVEDYSGVVGQLSATDVLGVEKFVIQHAAGDGNDGDYYDVDIDLINVDAALSDIEIVDSTAADDTDYYFYNQQNAINSVTFKRLGGSLVDGDAQVVEFINPKESLYSGASDTQTWNLENVDLRVYSANNDYTGSTNKSNAIENLVINATGKENDFDWYDYTDVVKSVTVKGDGDLNINIEASDAITYFDASAATGDLYVEQEINLSGDLTFKGSQGDNYITDNSWIKTGADKQTLNFTSFDGVDQVEVNIYHSDAVVNITTGGNSDYVEIFNDAEANFAADNVEYTKLTVNAGAGDDYVWLTELIAGASITLGAGNDTLAIGAVAFLSNLDLGNLTVDGDGVTVYAKAATEALKVTDFAAGDKLDLSFCDALTKEPLDNIELANLAAQSSLASALSTLEDDFDLNAGEFASFVWGGSTYIYFIEDELNDDYGNGLIQLVGFTGALTSSNFVAPAVDAY